jgi:hypothetical protein
MHFTLKTFSILWLKNGEYEMGDYIALLPFVPHQFKLNSGYGTETTQHYDIYTESFIQANGQVGVWKLVSFIPGMSITDRRESSSLMS